MVLGVGHEIMRGYEQLDFPRSGFPYFEMRCHGRWGSKRFYASVESVQYEKFSGQQSVRVSAFFPIFRLARRCGIPNLAIEVSREFPYCRQPPALFSHMEGSVVRGRRFLYEVPIGEFNHGVSESLRSRYGAPFGEFENRPGKLGCENPSFPYRTDHVGLHPFGDSDDFFKTSGSGFW